MAVKEKALALIRQEGLLTPETVAVVGVSGGADSVTLLHLLVSLRREGKLADVVAVHIHHGLRGEEADRDAAFAEQFCASLRVPFVLFKEDVRALAATLSCGLEEAGRRCRYRRFEEVASRYSNAVIATAHTADDQAETVLLHLTRGCGIHGLTGIPVKRGHIVRPLLTCTRREIEEYCRVWDLSFVNDSTNTDVTFSRNRIRQEVLPALRAVNPQVERTLRRLAQQMRQSEAYLSAQAKPLLETAQTDRPGCYRAEPLRNAPVPLQPYLLWELFRTAGVAVRDCHIRQAAERLMTGGEVALPDGWFFYADREKVWVTDERRHPFSPPDAVSVTVGVPFDFAGKRYLAERLSREEYEQKLKICKFLFENAFDCGKMVGDLICRVRLPGDYCHPAGRHCGKSLKKWLNEKAVPVSERDVLPIFCDERGIVLVMDVGCDERVRLDTETNTVLVIKKTEE